VLLNAESFTLTVPLWLKDKMSSVCAVTKWLLRWNQHGHRSSVSSLVCVSNISLHVLILVSQAGQKLWRCPP